MKARVFSLGGQDVTISLDEFASGELVGLSARLTKAQQALNSLVHLRAQYGVEHKRSNTELWEAYKAAQGLVDIAGNDLKKSATDFENRWKKQQPKYSVDVEVGDWLDAAYEVLLRIHIPRLMTLERLGAEGQRNMAMINTPGRDDARAPVTNDRLDSEPVIAGQPMDRPLSMPSQGPPMGLPRQPPIRPAVDADGIPY